MKDITKLIRNYISNRSTRRIRRQFLTIIACVVTFITTYALILPALTIEKGALICGKEVHTHSDTCYEKILICDQAEGEDHAHNAGCYENKLICEKEQHVHSKNCYQKKAKDSDVSSDRTAEMAGASEGTNLKEDANGINIPDENDSNDENNSEDIEEELKETAEKSTEKTDAERKSEVIAESPNEIRFTDIMTENTGLWHVNKDGQWSKVNENTTILSGDAILVRFTYRIPIEQLDQNNATMTYTLPAALRLSSDRVDVINENNNSRNPIIGGHRKPGEKRDKTVNSDYDAGEFTIEKVEINKTENDESSAFNFGSNGTWQLVCTFSKESIHRNKSDSIEGWLSFVITTDELETDKNGQGTIVFADQTKAHEKIYTDYQITEEEENIEPATEKENIKEGTGEETEEEKKDNEEKTTENGEESRDESADESAEKQSGEKEIYIMEEPSSEEATREIYFLEEYDDTTEETTAEETTEEETTVEETTVEETTVEETTVEETSSEETTEEETTAEETTAVEETSEEETTTEETSSEETPEEGTTEEESTTVEETSVEETSVEETTLAEETSEEETPAEETTVEETTAEETTAEETTVEETTLAEETTVAETTIEETTAVEETTEEESPAEETTVEETSAEENTVEETTLAEETSTEETAAEETSSEETTEEETTVEETTAVEETSEEETTEEETTEEETTAEETTLAEETSAEETSAEEMAALPAQSFESATGNVSVVVYAGAGAFPPGTTMVVEDVDDDDTVASIEDAVKGSSGNMVESAHIVAVDITFYNAEGQKIDPLIPIHVAMSPLSIPENIPDEAVPVVVHVDDNGNTEVIEQRAVEEVIEEIREEESESIAEEIRKEESKAEESRQEAQSKAEEEQNKKTETDENGEAEENSEAEQNTGSEENLDEETEFTEAPAEESQKEEFEGNSGDGLSTGMKNTLQSSRKNSGLSSARSEASEDNGTEVESILPLPEEAIVFTADSFSIYAVAYTVDFHYEINGQTVEFSIPGGGFISLEHLVEILGIAEINTTSETNTNDDNPIKEVNIQEAIEREAQYSYETMQETSAQNDVNEESKGDGSNQDEDSSGDYEKEEKNPADSDSVIEIDSITISEATKKFVAEVDSVEFSSPSLVWVGKIEETSTIGEIKKANDLEVQYSIELTESDKEEINAQTVEAGDWALISILPFKSQETLTVTMKNGDRFEVKVTDDQISNFDLLVNNGRYVLYIDVEGTYYALDNTGNTVLVPDNNLDKLPSNYLWRFTSQKSSHPQDYNPCSWMSGGNYLDVYWTADEREGKENPVVSASNSDNWIPVVRLIPHGTGFYFCDLNEEYLGARYFLGPAYYRNRFLSDNYDSRTGTHHLQTVFGNDFYYDFWRNLHGNQYNGAATIYVYKQGSAHTVKAQSNDETFGHVKYTEGNNNQQTSATHTILEILTENNVEQEKAVSGSFTAVPEKGYKFTGWEVIHINSWDTYDVLDWGQEATLESSTIYPTVSGDLVLQANFAPEKLYPFTVRTNDENMGTVGGENQEGSNVEGQKTFTATSGVVIDGTGKNACNLSAVHKPLHKFVRWELAKADGTVVWTSTEPDISKDSFELTEDGMTLTAIFSKKNDTEIDVEDIDTLLGSWKKNMTSDFVGVNKTAHVTDPENRIYEIDLSASSGKWAVETSLNLDFITDTSRSMFFPANLEYAKGTEAASSFKKLSTWLKNNGTIGQTYYVISEDTTATMYAVYHNGTEWVYRDASYNYNLDNEHRNPDAVPDSLNLGKTITGKIYISGRVPDAYIKGKAPDTLTEYWSRLDYLYKAVMTATETLKTLDPQAAVHLTTFNKASTNKGWIVQSTDSTKLESAIYTDKLRGISPSGGTRQDEGLYTSRTGEDRSDNTGPGNKTGVGNTSAFADGSHRHFAILITDGAPNPPNTSTDIWGNSNGSTTNSIFGQAKLLKDIKDNRGNPLTLMTLGISLDFVHATDRENMAQISSDPSKYAKAANNGGQIVTAIEELVESMAAKAALFGTVSDTLDPAFYPVKSNGDPITAGFYTMTGEPYTPSANDTREYCQWSRNGDSWTITYYNQTFKWPVRDTNGNIETNGWNQAFYAKAKENFMGGNAIETNNVGSTTFTATHTILMDSNGNYRVETKKKIVDNKNKEKPIIKNDIPTPHVNVKQLTLTENNNEWKVYIQTGVEPVSQIKALYDNILIQEVVDSSTEYMITDKAAMLFNPPNGTDPETLYLKDVFGDSNTIDWSRLTVVEEEGGQTAYVDLPYSNMNHNYGHNTGNIRLTLTKEGDTADYNDHLTSGNLNDVETYVLSAQFIPYSATEMINAHGERTATHDYSYHTTPLQSPGAEQLNGKPSENTHEINLFVRGLAITKTDAYFAQGLAGAEFTVFRPATEQEIEDNKKLEPSENKIKTFDGDTGKYIFDRNLTFDNNGVAYVNGVRSLTPPQTTYYLVETKAPEGYVLREDPIPVVLEVTNEYTPLPVAEGEQAVIQDTKPESGLYKWEEKATLKMISDHGILRTTGTYDPTNPDTVYNRNPDPTSEYEVMYYRISNNPGAELPATGGPGTNRIYLFGIMLVGIAGTMLVRMRWRGRAI